MTNNKEDVTYGGFSRSNIRKWLLEKILKSGKPFDMIAAIYYEMRDIDNEANSEDCYEDSSYFIEMLKKEIE